MTIAQDTMSEVTFLTDESELGALMRLHDWSTSPLGAPGTWPQSLRTVVGLMLTSKFPMFVAWGPELGFLYNDSYAEILGAKHPLALGMPFRDVWAEIWSDISPLVDAAMAGEATYRQDLPLVMNRRGHDERTWFTFSYSPVHDDGDRIAGMFCACAETTQTVLAERSLRDSETRLRFMLALDEALRSSRDAPHSMLVAAESLARRLGASRTAYADVDADTDRFFIRDDFTAPGVASSAGEYSLDLFGPRAAADMRAGRTLVVRDVASELDGGDGRDMFLSIGIGAIVCCPLVKGGRLVAMMAVHQDAPREWRDDEVALVEAVAERCWAHVERVGAEARLRDLNETLEQRVAEEVAERAKAEDALRQAQKMEAVGQLTGGIAHDFNNLLTGVMGSLEMVQVRTAQGRTDDVDRYLAAARGAATRAAALTHRLLAFSRRQTLAPKPTNVKALVTGMEELIRRSVGPGIEVGTVNAAGLWPSLIDPSQLENAVLNLCINARDAMPDGGRITIETGNRWMDRRTAAERGLEPGQYISLCVSDTGAGMPPEVVAKVFEPFFTTKPIGMGTGLGLSMIYGFARQSGGMVSVYSEVGQGTTVCIYLPRHAGAAEAEPDEAEPADAPRADAGETVLVVDDEPTVRMLIAEVLTDLGYTSIEAGDGPGGLRIVQSDVRIDLLVTDVGLPGGMNGRQVAEAAREARPGLKVLFITGYAENAVLSHGHLDPGMHVLTKPFALEALASRIREIIGG